LFIGLILDCRGMNKITTPFVISRPSAKSVLILGSWDGWVERLLMNQTRPGVFSFTLDLIPGNYEYLFLVDGFTEIDTNQTVEQATTRSVHPKRVNTITVHPGQLIKTLLTDTDNKDEQKNGNGEVIGEGGKKNQLKKDGNHNSNDSKRAHAANKISPATDALDLKNHRVNCYLNGALQLLNICDIPWNKASSDFGKLLSQYFNAGITKEHLLEEAGKCLGSENLHEAGDIREVTLLLLKELHTKDRALVHHLLFKDPFMIKSCIRCQTHETKKEAAEKLFMWLHEKLPTSFERVVAHSHKLDMNSIQCSCLTEQHQFQFRTIFYETYPVYAFLFFDNEVDLSDLIAMPSGPHYELAGFSINTSHCKVMVHQNEKWLLCSDVEEVPVSLNAYKTKTPHLVSVYKKV